MFEELFNPTIEYNFVALKKKKIFTRYYVLLRKTKKDRSFEYETASETIMYELNLTKKEYKLYIKKFNGHGFGLPRFKKEEDAKNFANSISVLLKMKNDQY